MKTPEAAEIRILPGLRINDAMTGQTFTWYRDGGSTNLFADNPEVQAKLAQAIRNRETVVAAISPPNEAGEREITGVITTGRRR